MYRIILVVTTAILASPVAGVLVPPEEGMFPVNEIVGLNLAEKGLEISPLEIFNPNPGEPCLVDGICRVNGCTGSFVSPDGLIITNHHCAYRAIQTASTASNDLLANGFVAANRNSEIPAPGYEVRITETYRDVSTEVLSAVTGEMDFVQRTRAIEKRQKEIEKQAEADQPGIRAEVAEMFAGKTYVLFQYTFIKDVRLVFAPPSSVGNFGGEVDNWEWPRHTGDFTFMRAYVAPDGKPATFADNNIPYHPRRHIQVAAAGVAEGDFVFLLGYPGRTARHKTTAFLRYEQNVRLPFIVELYQWQIGVLEAAGNDDRDVALKHSSRIKSLANVEKRSRGQLQGLRRSDIVAAREASENGLQEFIESDTDRKVQYATIIDDIASVYHEMAEAADHEMNLESLKSVSRAMATAFAIVDAAHERQKEDLDREPPWMERNLDQTRQQLSLAVRDWHAATDKVLLDGMRERLAATKTARELPALQPLLHDKSNRYGDEALSNTPLGDPDRVSAWLDLTPNELSDVEDPFIGLMLDLYPEYLRLRELGKQRDGRLDRLYGSLIDVKQDYLQTDFVPDANSTLRMTYGYVESYSPEDAVLKTPVTTLHGVIEKTTGEEPFATPARIRELYDAGAGEVPVNILYSTDTTGGNSGSPILNAKGQLVGVNFDRTFEATINDFAWNHNYSRSIGVDVRYALWITGEVYGATCLLDEMGIVRK